MSSLTVRLPDSIHSKLRILAKKDNVSINQLIASAVTEKVSALMTDDYLAERAARGNRERFMLAMAQVPDVEPEANDAL